MKALSNFRWMSRALSSHIHGAKFKPVETNIYEFLLSACESDDSKLMASFEMHNVAFTFGEMHGEAEKFSSGLINLGVRAGDRVAIWGPNQPEWLVMKWACARAGFEMVNINPLYTTRELQYALEKVDAKVLVCPKSIGPLDYHRKVEEMIPDLAKQDRWNLSVPCVPTLNMVVYYSCSAPVSGVIQWSEVEQAGGQDDLSILNETIINSHSIANIQFTSGTTGMPKAAALSHFNLTNNAIAMAPMMNKLLPSLHENSRILNVLPLYHVFSYVAGSLLGAHYKVPNIFPSPGFNSAAAIKACDDRKCTILIGTPTMFTDIINDPIRHNHDMSSLSYAIVGGAPTPPALVRRAQEELKVTTSVGYGMTENSCATFLSYLGEGADDTVGHPIPGIEAKIIDEEEKTLERNETGELTVKGFVLFQGYVKDQAKTDESMTSDGFWKTGDLARLRDDGMLQLIGRSKDMIIRGGENIQPTEIENYICTHPQVKDCYVVGVPSARLGEEVAAYVQLSDDSVDVDDIIAFCRTGLAKFKIPRFIKFTDDYPKTVTGKIQKFLLRKMAFDDFPELKQEMEKMH